MAMCASSASLLWMGSEDRNPANPGQARPGTARDERPPGTVDSGERGKGAYQPLVPGPRCRLLSPLPPCVSLRHHSHHPFMPAFSHPLAQPHHRHGRYCTSRTSSLFRQSQRHPTLLPIFFLRCTAAIFAPPCHVEHGSGIKRHGRTRGPQEPDRLFPPRVGRS